MTTEVQAAREWLSENADAVEHCCDHGLTFTFDACAAKGPTIECCFCSFGSIFTNQDDVTKKHSRHGIEQMCISVFCLNGLEEYQNICAREGRICAIKEINVTFIDKLLGMAQTCNRPLSQFETKHHLPFSLPLTAEMGNESARFRSFLKINPVYLQRLNIPALYQAGFYYAERLDSIRCYYCDTKVRNWKEQYCKDDMFREHALENPSCLHLVLTKGLPFVDAIWKERNSHKRKSFFVDDAQMKILRDTPIQAKSDI